MFYPIFLHIGIKPHFDNLFRNSFSHSSMLFSSKKTSIGQNTEKSVNVQQSTIRWITRVSKQQLVGWEGSIFDALDGILAS